MTVSAPRLSSFMEFVPRMLAVCAVLVGGVAANGSAATPIASASHCAAAPYHAFDFWLGAWTVRDAKGRVQGRNVVSSEYRGCVVQEHWESITPDGLVDQTGSSFSAYDARTKQWHHSWFDSFGNVLQLDGGALPGGGMRMAGRHLTAKGTNALERTTWTPLPGGRLHQVWDYSLNDGRTWKLRFEGFYEKEVA